MNPEKSPPRGNVDEEIFALIETLHQSGQRLEELTAGEVDTVADRDGRPVLLRRAQEHMRHNEAAKQAATKSGEPIGELTKPEDIRLPAEMERLWLLAASAAGVAKLLFFVLLVAFAISGVLSLARGAQTS